MPLVCGIRDCDEDRFSNEYIRGGKVMGRCKTQFDM